MVPALASGNHDFQGMFRSEFLQDSALLQDGRTSWFKPENGSDQIAARQMLGNVRHCRFKGQS